MTDAYYELIDSDASGERFRATDLARGTWSATIQHGGPVSALLTRPWSAASSATTPGCPGW